MSDKKLAIKLSTLEGIGNALREKEGSTEAIPVNALADRIGALKIVSGENKLAQMVEGTLTEITAEDLEGITELGQAAFSAREQLKTIVIPESVTKLGGSAFSGCKSLETIRIPSKVTLIDRYCFNNCKKLKTMIIGDTTLQINSDAFQSVGITDVYYEGSIEKWCGMYFIGSVATPFWNGDVSLYLKNDEGNYEALENLVVPDGITKLNSYLFSKCISIKTAIIPDSVTNFGQDMFSICRNLESAVLGNGITNVRGYTFRGCEKLTNVTLGNATYALDTSAFQECVMLSHIDLPDTLTRIENYVFSGCENLLSLTIPSLVTKISNHALLIGSTENKATITFLSTTPPTIDTTTFDTTKLNKIIVPVGCGDVYKSATNWANFADFIEEAAE